MHTVVAAEKRQASRNANREAETATAIETTPVAASGAAVGFGAADINDEPPRWPVTPPVSTLVWCKLYSFIQLVHTQQSTFHRHCHGRTGPPGYLAFAGWAGWSGVQVGHHVKC